MYVRPNFNLLKALQCTLYSQELLPTLNTIEATIAHAEEQEHRLNEMSGQLKDIETKMREAQQKMTELQEQLNAKHTMENQIQEKLDRGSHLKGLHS